MENVIIIGGGPAGLAAAIYNARANLKPLVIAGSPPGGQLTLTTEVENYPGFESILGPELILKMRKHAEKFGVRFFDQNVVKVDFSKKPFEVFLPDSSSTTKSVIIATGAKALWLNLPSEQRLRGKGVSACATCDGFFFKEKTVAVIGGGDTAMEEALTLTKFAKKVYIVHRRDSFRASKIMQDRVLNNKRIEVILNSQVEEVLGELKVEGIRITGRELQVDGVFIAIGHKPDTDVFKGKIELDKKGYIVVKDYMTTVPGVFAAGDCVDHKYRQAATAVGMGVAAALEVERYLEG
ncbi:thioredoxin-disulfide reductase [Candidatus Roizmanbacteria bacterium]|nr:thioredoxin-disulfide reductase [Candidatus Roizmanbacteria bacterium]